MNKDQNDKSILIAILCALLFVVLLVLLRWHFVVSAVLAVLLYFGLSLYFSPVRTLGGVAVEKIDQGQRLASIYELAESNLQEMEGYTKRVRDLDMAQKAMALTSKGTNILEYLSKNPKSISTSEHFLSYYLSTANKILDNYVEMQDSKVSQEKAQLIQSETDQSLDYLQEIFTKQLDSYYDEKILSLEIESDLLEKTVKLGGGRK